MVYYMVKPQLLPNLSLSPMRAGIDNCCLAGIDVKVE